MKKYIPNILSSSRIVFAFALFFFARGSTEAILLRNKIIFTVLYCLIAVTDAFDGYFARRFNAQSKLGGRLDTFGDAAMFVVGFTCIVFLLPVEFVERARSLATLGIGIACKAFNFIHTRARFGEWNMLHTYTNKLLGGVLYLSLPIFLWLGEINYWVVLGIVVFGVISSAEEEYLLFNLESYDVNQRGFLFDKLWPKKELKEETLSA